MSKNILKSCIEELRVNDQAFDEIEEKVDCVPIDFREDIVEDIQPTIQVICISLIVISFLMLLASFKWHKLVDYVIYEEMLYHLVIAFIPNN